MSEFLWWNQTRLEDCGDFLWDKSPTQFGLFTRTIVLPVIELEIINCAKRIGVFSTDAADYKVTGPK